MTCGRSQGSAAPALPSVRDLRHTARMTPAVLAGPRRRAADLAVHVAFDDLPDDGVPALLRWVLRCRAQGVRLHVDVVSPAAVGNAILLGLCATTLALHVPVATDLVQRDAPRRGAAHELCRQLRRSGVGAHVVGRARSRTVAFSPSLPVSAPRSSR